MTTEHCSGILGQLRGMVLVKKSGVHHADMPRKMRRRTSSKDGSIPFLKTSASLTFLQQGQPQQTLHEKYYTAFKEERLEIYPPTNNVHDPVLANKLKTFANLCKKKKKKDESRLVVLWPNYSDGTSAKFKDVGSLVSSPWTITMGSLNT